MLYPSVTHFTATSNFLSLSLLLLVVPTICPSSTPSQALLSAWIALEVHKNLHIIEGVTFMGTLDLSVLAISIGSYFFR